ncbi:MAG: hypothetical protein ACHQQP_06645 [Gemmatimonadales bacterium]
MAEQIAAGLPIELVILKARQFGISTFFCAWIFWQMWRKMYTKAAIVAFRRDTTLKELNETMATFYSSFPPNFRPRLRQHRKNARVGKEELYFDDRKADCMFVVQAPDAMRGVAREVVLTTEVSFYKEAAEFYGGFLPAMIKGTSRTLVLESSAADGYFREQYEAAKESRGTRRAIFLPWWFVPSLYARALTRRGKRLFDARTDDPVRFMPSERKEQEALSRMAAKVGRPPVTDEQMYWRQDIIDQEYNGDEEFFNQEYPRDDVSAFERATSSAFKIALPLVRKTSEEAFTLYPNAGMGLLQSRTYVDPTADQIIEFEPEQRIGWIDQERRGGLLLIREPVAGYTYTIGADVASDVQEDESDSERAFSTGCVYCCNTREQVAEWRGHIDPHDWGDELVKLGYYYNTAMICVERNNMGVTTEDRIKRYLNYPIRFRWPDMNTGMSAFTKKEMWETNSRTKILMMGVLKQWLRDGLFIVRSPGLAFELAHYQIKNGRYQNGDTFSDRIIAAALAIQCVEQTDFAYKAIVLAANGETPLSADGAAARELKRSKGSPVKVADELPDEFGSISSRVSDLWEMARL